MSGLAFVIAAVCLSRGDHGELPAEWKKARTLYYRYYRGIDGDDRAYESAQQLFSELYGKYPCVPLIQVYYGSLRLFEAGRTWALWKKNDLSGQGIRLMDGAVAAQPDNLEIRFVRAATTYHLPTFFHRRRQTKSDFAFLARFAIEAAKTGRLEPRLASASLYFHGEFLEEAGHKNLACSNWRSAIELAPGSPVAAGARKKLKELGQ
jgi:hypothetical protein